MRAGLRGWPLADETKQLAMLVKKLAETVREQSTMIAQLAKAIDEMNGPKTIVYDADGKAAGVQPAQQAKN